jgi:hypothetical protein
MRSADSMSPENFAMESEIFRGCSVSVVNKRSTSSGRRRINSTVATTSERLLFTSCRNVESFRFNSLICSTLKVIGSVGKAICRIIAINSRKSSRFPEWKFLRRNWSERRDSNPRHKNQNHFNRKIIHRIANQSIHKYAHRF